MFTIGFTAMAVSTSILSILEVRAIAPTAWATLSATVYITAGDSLIIQVLTAMSTLILIYFAFSVPYWYGTWASFRIGTGRNLFISTL